MSKRTYTGKVKSAKMQKTIVVSVDVPKKHKIYGKSIKQTKNFKVHSDLAVKVGDKVQIEESRPYSKQTTWVVVTKLEESK